MKWTEEKPTEPGHYWVKPENEEIFMVKVIDDDGNIWFEEFGDNNWRYAWEYSTPMEWYGPIVPPKEG